MDQALYILILVILFACVVWGAFWICDKAGFPPPVRWIVAAILLVLLLFGVARMFGGGGDGRFFDGSAPRSLR